MSFTVLREGDLNTPVCMNLWKLGKMLLNLDYITSLIACILFKMWTFYLSFQGLLCELLDCQFLVDFLNFKELQGWIKPHLCMCVFSRKKNKEHMTKIQSVYSKGEKKKNEYNVLNHDLSKRHWVEVIQV